MGLFSTVENWFRALAQPSKPSQNRKSSFIDNVKKNPNMFFELINRAKEKIQEKLVTVKEKLVDIKKSIARLNLAINKTTRKVSLLANNVKTLQEQLKKVRDKISELEKRPGQEKNIEVLKMREKEILEKLRELNLQIQAEQNRIKQLEMKKNELEVEKDTIERTKEKYQIRLTDLDSQKFSFEQALGIVPQRIQPLQKVLHNQIRENARLRQQEPTQTSYEHLAFRATLDQDFNMQNVESAKVLPIDGIVGKTPQHAYDDSIVAQRHVRNRFIASRLNRAEENGFSVTPSKQHHEHGGKDNPDR